MPYKDKQKQDECISRISSTVTIRLVNSTDRDILDWLKTKDHPSTAIKEVLHKHVKEEV